MLVFAGLFLGACAESPSIDDVRAARSQKDHETAVRLAYGLASKGHSGAHYLLGVVYANGEGVPQDFDMADRWFQRYVAMRNGRDEYYLSLHDSWAAAVATFYDNAAPHALATVVNSDRAVAWYKRAIAGGSTEALLRLGDLHRLGRGVPKDPTAALSLYRRAADTGNVDGYNYMGRLYLSGELGATDPARAMETFLDGIEKGDEESALGLGEMYLEGRGVAKEPQLARAWLVAATLMGHTAAPRLLMSSYLWREIPADDWRVRGLSWGLVTHEGRILNDQEYADFSAGLARIAPFTEEEIRAARRRADAFNAANPNWQSRGVSPD